MNFKSLKKEEFETAYPNNKILSIDKMSETEISNYLSLYNVYRNLFSQYIIENMGLKEYDEKLANSGLGFLVNNQEDMDIYQYYSSDTLKYFYIRNNIYIERLTKEERDFLREKISNNNYELDDASRQMIEETYERVIFEDALKNGEKCNTLYGPNSTSFLAPNNALVIGVRYDEFAENGLDDKSWDELHDKQALYLYQLMDSMRYNLGKKVSLPVAILKYNEYSVIKKDMRISKNNEKKNKDEEER